MQSKADLEKLRHSCLILMSCYAYLETLLRPGVSAGELDQKATEFIRDHGGEPSFLGYDGFKYALCTSLDNEVVHGISPQTKIIPENSLVSLDLGVRYQGMYSDSAKSYILGDMPLQAKLLLEATKEALWSGIRQVKAGNRTGDIGAAVDKVARQHGLGNVLELGGHGLGYEVHAEPFILHAGKPGKGSRLFENQVIAIEPMFTLGSGDVEFDATKEDGWTVRTSDGSLAAHFEHTLLVTKKGVEVLTDIPEDKFLK